jgi:hypothetical protein
VTDGAGPGVNGQVRSQGLGAGGTQAIPAGGTSAAEQGGQVEHFPVGQPQGVTQLEQALFCGQGVALVVAGHRGSGPVQVLGRAGLAAVAADPVDHGAPAAAEFQFRRGRLITGMPR